MSVAGLVIPVEWTKSGAVRAVALAAFDDALYHLAPGAAADRLAGLVRREVTVRGYLSQQGSKAMIEVKDFSLTQSRKRGLAGLAMAGMLGLSLVAGGALAAEPAAQPKPAPKAQGVEAAPQAEVKAAPKKAAPKKKATKKTASKKKKKQARKSPSVAKAQQALTTAGFPLKADGIIGPKTRAALKQYQKQQKLKITGRLDKATKKALGV